MTGTTVSSSCFQSSKIIENGKNIYSFKNERDSNIIIHKSEDICINFIDLIIK